MNNSINNYLVKIWKKSLKNRGNKNKNKLFLSMIDHSLKFIYIYIYILLLNLKFNIDALLNWWSGVGMTDDSGVKY